MSQTLLQSVAQTGITGQRLLLQCQDAQTEIAAIDALCLWLRQHTHEHFGLLMLHGALISNISVAENLWLMCSWHTPRKPALLLREMQTQLDALGIAQEESKRLLVKRPAELSTYELRITLLLRCLLIAPQVLVLDNEWFTGHSQIERDLLRRAAPLLDHCHWWVVSDDAELPETRSNWTSYNIHYFLNELLS